MNRNEKFNNIYLQKETTRIPEDEIFEEINFCSQKSEKFNNVFKNMRVDIIRTFVS